MPTVQTPIKPASSRGFTAFFSIMSEGRLRVVTAIMKVRMVPRLAPLISRLSATGMVPNMSAYMGMPTRVAKITAAGLRLPNTVSTQVWGITLWITAPMATPIKI